MTTARKGAKTSSLTPRTQPGKNGGTLRVGGTNKGGPGRPPSIIREQLRGSFAERVAILEEIADGTCVQKMRSPTGVELETLVSADVSERIKAIDMLAKYGLGTVKEVSVEAVRERVVGTLAVIRSHCSAEQAAQIVAALRPIWA